MISVLSINTNAQKTTVVDHRDGKDSTKITFANNKVSVDDHRILRNMSPSLVKPAYIDDMIVYRIQLQITVSDHNGTDDPISVRLNERTEGFHIATPNSLQPGSKNKYDILNPFINKLRDLQFIKLNVDGSDGLCISKLELFINNCNSPIYSSENIPENKNCFDNDSPGTYENLYISYYDLRKHPNWNFAGAREDIWRPSTKITKEWLSSLIEAEIGNHIVSGYPRLFKWGTPANPLKRNTLFGQVVDIEYGNNHTLKVDLDLETNSVGPKFGIAIGFQINFRCESGVIQIEGQSIKVITELGGSAGDTIRSEGSTLIDRAIGTKVRGMGPLTLRNILAFKIDNLNPNNQIYSISCKKIIVTKEGDLVLQ